MAFAGDHRMALSTCTRCPSSEKGGIGELMMMPRILIGLGTCQTSSPPPTAYRSLLTENRHRRTTRSGNNLSMTETYSVLQSPSQGGDDPNYSTAIPLFNLGLNPPSWVRSLPNTQLFNHITRFPPQDPVGLMLVRLFLNFGGPEKANR